MVRAMAECNWRVGIACGSQAEDKRYYHEWEAIEGAERMAVAKGFYVPIGIWDFENNLKWLFMCGEQFRKV